MKKHSYFITGLCLIIFMFSSYNPANAADSKRLRQGKLQTIVFDTGDMGEGIGWRDWGSYYYNGYTRNCIEACAYYIAVPNWTDEFDVNWPVKMSGTGTWTSDEEYVTMPVPDAEGITIRNYLRYPPPSITVDGFKLEDPFPFDAADEVNPSKIPGTADAMTESWVNTDMGVTMHQKTLSYAQKGLDEVIIYDWTFINTGNVDLDDEIELPNQTLTGLYFLRSQRPDGRGGKRWHTSYGEHTTDSLRIVYSYSPREEGEVDDVGDPQESGFLRIPYMIGEAILHADESASNKSDDPSQPRMTWSEVTKHGWAQRHPRETSPEIHQEGYRVMQEGLNFLNNVPYNTHPDVYPGTFHGLRPEFQAELYSIPYYKSFAWYAGAPAQYWSCGPYTLAPNDSVRIVFAMVLGSISPEVAWRVGKEWKAGICTFDTTTTANGRDNLPHQFKIFPDLAPTENDKAKDRWVFTGRDSLFRNAGLAQWAVQNDYNIPAPPPAPSINVSSLPDKINITWGDESLAASDLAGYRVYRALGDRFYNEEDGVVGKWTAVYTANAQTQSWDDDTAERGQPYYYAVTAFNDAGLESGMYLNMTIQAASLTRAAGASLADIRVVPNPFNIKAAELQYLGEQDKILFVGLPPKCTIRIFTESGDLVKTLEHTNGSGDESWGILKEQQSATESGQKIVSGIYIAYIETPSGDNTFLKFLVVR